MSAKTQSKKSLQPKLRFPEFRDGGGWEVKSLGDLFTIGNGRNYKHLGKGDMPVYGTGGYMLSVDDYLYDGESVCIGRKGTIDKPIFLTGKFWTVDTLFYTHSFRECLPKFIFSIFQNIDWKEHNEAGGIPSLSKANIEKIKAAVPKLTEQQKIADCLSSLDELIDAEAQKLDTLKDHKKGLMQQLFPAEGETLPKRRFSEFRAAWKVITIGDIAKVTTGNKDTQNKKEDGAYPFFVRSQTVERIDSFSYNGEAILTSGDGVGVGRNFHYMNGKFDFHQRVYCIYGFAEDALANFVFHYFSSNFYKRIKKLSAKNSVDSVRMPMITEMPIGLPSPKEQHRIAAFLSSIDDLITTQNQKIDALREHKKGLMQQLFPTLSEAQE